jgi:hypothetical protein
MQNAIGLIETKGLLALIEATDAMAKAASVEIVKRIDIGGAYVTTIVSTSGRRSRSRCGFAGRRTRQQSHHSSSFRRFDIRFPEIVFKSRIDNESPRCQFGFHQFQVSAL